MRPKKIVMTMRDVTIMVAVVAGLNPEEYTSKETQALILRCQDAMEATHTDCGARLKVVPE